MNNYHLWVEKYRPTQFDNLLFHKDVAEHLKPVLKSNDFPHLLLYGQSGSGKRTLMKCILYEIFGSGSSKTKGEAKEIDVSKTQTQSIVIVSSQFHYEINPSDVGFHDRMVVQQFIKDIASTLKIPTKDSKQVKVIVILEADKLTKEAQAALRRTMEKYMFNFRIIFICENSSKIISPLKSRCMLIRVESPEVKDIQFTLEQILIKEKKTNLNKHIISLISDRCNSDICKAIMMLQTQSFCEENATSIIVPDYILACHSIADLILSEQSINALKNCREKFYEILEKCIPTNLIIYEILQRLLNSKNEKAKVELIDAAAEFDLRCQMGQKPIFHLEAFAANAMQILQKFK